MKTLNLILIVGGIDILLYTLTPSDGITQSGTGISVVLLYLGIAMIVSGICMVLMRVSKKHHSKNAAPSRATSTAPVVETMVESESVYSMRCIRILEYTPSTSVQ